MQRRPEFSFPGSPARGLPPSAPGNANPNPMAPRYGDEEARWLQASLQASPDYSSGTPSPQLWAQAQAGARAHHHAELHRQYPASAGISPSRAQAIAEYRREMLDLVRGLPESAYELSLRDIVEHRSPPSPPRAPLPPPPPTPPPPTTAQAQEKDEPAGARKDAVAADVEDGGGDTQGRRKGRRQRTMRKQRSRSLERSVSLDTGLLIKLFLPLSIGGRKKVSPKPDAAKDGKKKKEKKKAAVAAKEEDWWTKSEFSEAGSSSRTSSTGSSSNSSAASIRNVNGGSNPRAPSRSWSRKRTGCYAFFRANKGKNAVNQD